MQGLEDLTTEARCWTPGWSMERFASPGRGADGAGDLDEWPGLGEIPANSEQRRRLAVEPITRTLHRPPTRNLQAVGKAPAFSANNERIIHCPSNRTMVGSFQRGIEMGHLYIFRLA
jgi:hypothetical protein